MTYLVNLYDPPINKKDLHEPSKKQMSIMQQAYIENYMETKLLPKMRWFIVNATRFETPYAGRANKLSNQRNGVFIDDPYAIVIASFVFEVERFEYQMWVLKHELRHCAVVNNFPFRGHDVDFIDEGWKHKPKSGMFYEDFPAISCCDILMSMFSNLNGLEEYLG